MGEYCETKGTSLLIRLVACEAGGALGHALPPVDDELRVAEEVHLRAQVHGDAAPALELVGARGAVLHAAALVVVVQAGGARHVVVGLGAAAQALAVAALALVCAGERAALRTHWGDREDGAGGGRGRDSLSDSPSPAGFCSNKIKDEEGQRRGVRGVTAAVDGLYGFKMSHF